MTHFDPVEAAMEYADAEAAAVERYQVAYREAYEALTLSDVVRYVDDETHDLRFIIAAGLSKESHAALGAFTRFLIGKWKEAAAHELARKKVLEEDI